MTVAPSPSSPPTDSYTEIPYPRYSFPETHPARIAAVAELFGVSAPQVQKARILELGCAVGGNALALAAALPQTEIVAIDKSKSQIESAKSLASKAKLTNVSFECIDIAALSPSLGSFDYCIAHGLLSWIEPSLQPVLLRTIDSVLAPNGIAYVSFNTLPGWYSRRRIRDLMMFHARGERPAADALKRAREILQITHDALTHTPSSQAKYLQEEIAFIQRQSDGYLAHEYLEQENVPLYFSDFLRLLRDTKLRYLSDVALATMWPSEFPPKAQGPLTSLARSGAELEQYLDFIRNRSFRQSVLVKAPPTGTRIPTADALTDLYLGFPLWRMRTLDDGGTSFRDDTGVEMRVKEPHVAALLSLLAEHWPEHRTFRSIVEEGRRKEILKDHKVEELLMQCVMRGIVLPQQTAVSRGNSATRIQISSLAIEEAKLDGLVCNRLLHRFQLTPRMRAFFLLLEDAPSMQELERTLSQRIAGLSARYPELNTGLEEIASASKELLPKGLEFLTRNAFLNNV